MSNKSIQVDELHEVFEKHGFTVASGEEYRTEVLAELIDELEALIQQKQLEARRDELNKAHRADGGHDFDNETDEWIDQRIDELSTPPKKEETENALKLDLYYIQADELDEIVAKCEGKHTQQVVYSTYHKGFTRVCFGCMQVDTTIQEQPHE